MQLLAARPRPAQNSRLLARLRVRTFGSSMRVRLRQEDVVWGGRLRQRAYVRLWGLRRSSGCGAEPRTQRSSGDIPYEFNYQVDTAIFLLLTVPVRVRLKLKILWMPLRRGVWVRVGRRRHGSALCECLLYLILSYLVV